MAKAANGKNTLGVPLTPIQTAADALLRCYQGRPDFAIGVIEAVGP